MASPLLINRLKTAYPDGVTVHNLSDVVVDIAKHQMKYGVCERDELLTGVMGIITLLECSPEQWFVVFMVHSICDVLIRVRNGDIDVRKKKRWNCMG